MVELLLLCSSLFSTTGPKLLVSFVMHVKRISITDKNRITFFVASVPFYIANYFKPCFHHNPANARSAICQLM